ncbi:MAG: precorrin-2 C(20)-methyltransferase [Ruminococcus sp.]|uniref:precorrin-2 C(20)-methyltransferase n=1 Tax=Ruminococcus sp. TaxID=41978 RepID=UPI0025D42DE8|nr:precorrin-2 C(20)-methyltransferase [Ruminococcus sp.]MBR5683613.1 precorrin-2 C(20)-methyltransferase [Ruminococcus sp.]
MGKLYGVSVGAGDPQLMTLKAVGILERCRVIAVPRTNGESSLALSIAEKAVDLSRKRVIYLDFLMTSDRERLDRNHGELSAMLCRELEDGDVAFLTLGDISVYSTFGYIACRVEQAGFDVEVCAGVTSFCAAAAAVREPLCLGSEELHIIPCSCGDMEKALGLSGTKVIMKAGRKAAELIELIREKGLSDCTKVVSDCGLDTERIYGSVEDIDGEPGYFTLFIVNGREKFR